MSIFSKIKQALTKTSTTISKVGEIFTKKSIDRELIEEFEEIMLSVDFGVSTTNKIVSKLKSVKFSKEDSKEEFKDSLIEILAEILEKAENPIEIIDNKMNVILFCGVNGNGKTTTIGKLANIYKIKGKKVVVAACDTFRSAAAHQLKIWAERASCTIIEGENEADPASVAYKAIEEAQKIHADIVIIDTAGRLQNQHNLMDELSKIIRVIRKHDFSAPHHIILTLDATTGQNAFSQVEKFSEFAEISGIIFTKLDGTAKGGAIVGIVDKYNIPIHYISVGEKIDDLVEFDAKSFAKALVT